MIRVGISDFLTYARHRIWGALRDVHAAEQVKAWQKRGEKAKETKNMPYVLQLSPTSEERGLVLNTREDPPVGEESRLPRRSMLAPKTSVEARQHLSQALLEWKVSSRGC